MSSLSNIYSEYSKDLGFPTPSNGDLSPWCDQGVLMLNRVLTVQPGQPASALVIVPYGQEVTAKRVP